MNDKVTVKFRVTKKRIAGGEFTTPKQCPVAETVRPKLKKKYQPTIMVGGFADVEIDGTDYVMQTGREAYDSLLTNQYDAKPFIFTLEMPRHLLARSP